MNHCDLDEKIIKCVQGSIPDAPFPFKIMAEELAISEELLLERLQIMLGEGRIRRFAALLYHEKAGWTHNVLIALRVKEDVMESVAGELATRQEISHLYHRIPQKNFPFNLFAMTHFREELPAEQITELIIQQLPVEEIRLLPTTKGHIKRSPQFF